jgi:hypothetical protein
MTRFGFEAGSRMIEMVEAATGETCPCLAARRCPLLPDVDVPDQRDGRLSLPLTIAEPA